MTTQVYWSVLDLFASRVITLSFPVLDRPLPLLTEGVNFVNTGDRGVRSTGTHAVSTYMSRGTRTRSTISSTGSCVPWCIPQSTDSGS